jgi:hypothetical protein
LPSPFLHRSIEDHTVVRKYVTKPGKRKLKLNRKQANNNNKKTKTRKEEYD